MATAKRSFPSDHITHIGARSVAGGNQYAATLSGDGSSISVTKNGSTLHRRIFPAAHDSAHTDSNPNGDAVVIVGADGIITTGDFQQLLNSLK